MRDEGCLLTRAAPNLTCSRLSAPRLSSPRRVPLALQAQIDLLGAGNLHDVAQLVVSMADEAKLEVEAIWYVRCAEGHLRPQPRRVGRTALTPFGTPLGDAPFDRVRVKGEGEG